MRSRLLALLSFLLLAPSLAAEGPVRFGTLDEGVLRLELVGDLSGGAPSWKSAASARLIVRGPNGQRAIERPDGARLDLALEAGCSLVTVDFGKAAAKHLACRDAGSSTEILAARLEAAALLNSKIGSRYELRPMNNPATVKPGTDLTVRVYADGEARAGAMVTAVGPDGKARTATSDAVGAATLRLDVAGRWTLRAEHVGGAAELSFDVEGMDFWRRLPPVSALFAAEQPLVSSLPRKDGPHKDVPRWRELGPAPMLAGFGVENTGRIAGIVAHPRNANLYYAGAASGGVWKSVNGGRTWQPLGDGLPTLAIGALALDPNNDQVLYAGSGEANYAYHSLYGLGLYKSTDGGASWRVLAPEVFAGRTFSRLVVSPTDSREVWAAVARAGGTYEGFEGARRHPERDGAMGIFRSRDGGATWQHLRAPEGLPALPASDIDLDPRDSRRVYASFGAVFGAGRNGVYRSTDGGRRFVRLGEDQLLGGEVGRIALAIAPSRPDRLYALLVNPTVRGAIGGFSPPGASALAIARSDDGGDTWTALPVDNFMGQQGDYNAAITVHPSDPDTVFVGGVLMLRSRDGGVNWEDVTPLHVDLHDFAYDAAGRLLTAGDGGIHRGSDLGELWQARNRGLATVQIYAGISLHPTRPNVVVAGMQDNGTNLRLGSGKAWLHIFGGDGGVTAFRPDNPDILFVEYQGAAQIARSDDGGLSWVDAGAGIDENDRSCFLAPFLLDPRDPTRMLYATHRIYESVDGGRSWRAISGDLTGGAPAAVRSLVMAPADPDVVYAMTNDGRVLVSIDGGAEWELIRQGVPGWPRVTRQLAVDPVRPAEIYVAEMGFGGDRVLRSPNRGATWQPIGRNLPDVPVNAVAVHRVGIQRLVFAGTDAGVYLSRDLGRTWEIYGAALPRAPVMDLIIDAERGRLVASTLGRGVWETALVE